MSFLDAGVGGAYARLFELGSRIERDVLSASPERLREMQRDEAAVLASGGSLCRWMTVVEILRRADR